MNKKGRLTTAHFFPLLFLTGWFIGNMSGYNKQTPYIVLICATIQIIILFIHYG